MQSLKEKVDQLLHHLEAGENDEAVFKQAYTSILAFVQLVYTEASAQFIEMRDAISLYKPGENFEQSRHDLKANCISVLGRLSAPGAA